MSEIRDTQRSLDLALRVGEMLLSNGAGAADVAATMSSITHHLGLRQALVDVTFTTLTLSHQTSFEDPPVVMRRTVTYRETDFADLASVDWLVTRLLEDEITRDEAASEVARLASTGHPRPRWSITVGWGVSGAGVALLLGGSWTVLLIAAIAGAGIEVLQRRMAVLRLPGFYAQAAGGLLATVLAVGLSAADVPIVPSQVVTASIVMLLAGLGFIGAIQDALTGYYITANARVLEVIISTTGIVAGVSVGLAIGSALGTDVVVEPGSAGLSQLPAVVAGAAVTAGGFAFTSYAPLRALLPVALIGAVPAGLFFLLLENGVGRATASAVAAIVIGLVSFPVARMAKVPPLVLIVSGIVPLLPGLSILRALSQLGQDDLGGLLSLVTAAAVALALSAGAILGEYVAQPLGREARRLEQRLAGPRLVGPLRARARRR